jgi:MFS family permease
MKQKRQKLIGATVIVWAIITTIGAFLYAYIGTRSPIEEPMFRSMWGWHLLMFAIYVLPISLIILGVVLWLEYRLFSSKQTDSE